MGSVAREDLRNLAVVAHVDHGKTTLVDAMLWQSGLLREHGQDRERLLGSLGGDREKGLPVMVKVASVAYRGARIVVVDTPSHANFGGEAERAVKMVEGFLYVVDCVEGPAPQTRFVLRKALEARLAPIVVLTKIDRPEARPREVLHEVYDLFIDLEAREEQLKFPVLYCDARRGVCRRTVDGPDEPLTPLFDEILRSVPPPARDPGEVLRLLVTGLDYDDFVGRMALGRIVGGTVRAGGEVSHCRLDGTTSRARVGGLYSYEGLRRVEVAEASAGEIVAITGVESATVGETVSDPDRPAPLPPLQADEPTIAVEIRGNDSPLAGLDGQYVSARKLRERLWKEILANVSIRVEEGGEPDVFRVSARGELQLAILIEMMRREGYEMTVGRPEILTRVAEGEMLEPIELLVVDCPEGFAHSVSQKVGARKGRMCKMVNHGTGRVRMEFRIPSRGLLGFRAEFLSDTRGTGILNHVFDGHVAWQGEIPERQTGALVADRPGRCTAYALEHIQGRGMLFVAPGDQVYEGMVVGEGLRPADVEVNVTKERKRSAVRSGGDPEAVRLIPPRSPSLEQALEFLRDDEAVEVTPRALRIRKRVLPSSQRAGARS